MTAAVTMVSASPAVWLATVIRRLARSRPWATAEEVRQLFDAHAATWPARYSPGGPLTGRLELFLAVLDEYVPAGGRVLDLGCGTGELARAAAVGGLRVAACDISAPMLRAAAAADGASAVDWVRLRPDWQSLPFPGNAFDAVLAASVLEYVGEPVAVLSECARVLRPGAIAVCTVPDLRHPIRWLEWPADATARTRLASAASRWPSPLGAHVAYLRASRHRHTAWWWRAAATRAGLVPLSVPAGSAIRSPLRLLLLRRPPAGQRSPDERQSAGVGQSPGERQSPLPGER
jgi:SAM-dependent methyltransferase